MSSNEYDVIVAGAGHNGLIVAAYLARAGLKIGVVERSSFVGGTVSTHELTLPGFKHDIAGTGHGSIQGNPLIRNDELKLKSKYGLKYIFPESPYACVFPDGSNIMIYEDLDKTCQSIAAAATEKDAETYRQFIKGVEPVIGMMSSGMFNPAPPLGVFFSQLDQSLDGQDLEQIFFKSCWDLAEENYDHPKTKMFLTRLASEILQGPEDKGTGIYFMMSVAMAQLNGMGMPEGGSQKLSDAIAQCLEDFGGEIRLNSEVVKINVSSGTATGVVLASGEEIKARKAVVCNFDPRLVFPKMISDVSERFQSRVDHIQSSPFSLVLGHYALDEEPQWVGGQEVMKAHHIECCPWEDEYRRMFDELRYHRVPEHFSLLAVCQSYHDPTRAPEGKHVLYTIQYIPYDPEGKGPDSYDRDELSDKIIAWMQGTYVSNIEKSVIGKKIMTGYDYERWNPTLIHGSVNGPAATLNQFFANRPIPDLGGYGSPIDGLYFSGASFHPGGSISGGGRNVAQVLCNEWDIDFDALTD